MLKRNHALTLIVLEFSGSLEVWGVLTNPEGTFFKEDHASTSISDK